MEVQKTMIATTRWITLRDDPPWPDRGWEEPDWRKGAEEEPWAEEIDDLDIEPDEQAWRELDDDSTSDDEEDLP